MPFPLVARNVHEKTDWSEQEDQQQIENDSTNILKRKDPEDLYEWKDCEYLETVSSFLEEINLMSKTSESEQSSLKNVNPIFGTRKSQRKQIHNPNDKKQTNHQAQSGFHQQ